MYRGVSILSYPLIKQIWVFCKSISIYFLALAKIYLYLVVESIYFGSQYP
jgi:hypothetical protein